MSVKQLTCTTCSLNGASVLSQMWISYSGPVAVDLQCAAMAVQHADCDVMGTNFCIKSSQPLKLPGIRQDAVLGLSDRQLSPFLVENVSHAPSPSSRMPKQLSCHHVH